MRIVLVVLFLNEIYFTSKEKEDSVGIWIAHGLIIKPLREIIDDSSLKTKDKNCVKYWKYYVSFKEGYLPNKIKDKEQSELTVKSKRSVTREDAMEMPFSNGLSNGVKKKDWIQLRRSYYMHIIKQILGLQK